ncbi:hypothetical protein D6C84_03569 [Aureobasidium pullulans]|uniref:PD-(D/E)XK nuclease-like domain-containing protein n=1 Tax=Aureobasidium pullulans TaxID=5580 RepID=A0A4S9XZN0_AURPU|nr:hypothetical protein D6C84_03569 [Aureobasidium pullulans]
MAYDYDGIEKWLSHSGQYRHSLSSAFTSSRAKRIKLSDLPRTTTIELFSDAEFKDAPLHFEKLVDGILEFERGVKTISEDSKAELNGIAIRADSMKLNDPDRYYQAFDTDRCSLGSSPPVNQVVHLLKRTRTLLLRHAHEAHWKSGVHHPLAIMALLTSAHMSETNFNNITLAQITPRFITQTGESVDFAITLEPDSAMNTALSEVPDRSWNHSQDEILRSEPICVNVETKSDSGNMTESEIQLGIWVSAQYLKLNELLTHNSKPLTLPWLPLLIVKGELWYLLLASHSNGITTLWSRHLIADSSTLTGIYTVISILQLLFQWANTEYRSWFEDNAVMP